MDTTKCNRKYSVSECSLVDRELNPKSTVRVFQTDMKHMVTKKKRKKRRRQEPLRPASVCCNSVTMKLQILLILFLQVAPVKSLREVSGYLGDNVTLPSGADPSWTLSSIEWSIFPNNTWIATYRNKRKNIDRVARYKGRLSLNISTGDLVIYNLATKDAMEYTVDLINDKGQSSGNKATVTVRQRLRKPTILTFASENGGCGRLLQCHSTDKGVQLSWQGIPPSGTVYNSTNPDDNSAVLFAFLYTTEKQVELTCTSSRNTEKASSVITSKCEGKKPEPQPLPHPQPDLWFRERCGIAAVVGFILGSIVTATIVHFCSVKRKKRYEINGCI